jgi:putative peptidoglycan lipid II flippase
MPGMQLFAFRTFFDVFLAKGALAVSFIPVFVEAEADSPERAKNLVNAFYTLFLILLSLVTAIGVIWPEPFFKALLDEAFISDFVKYELTIQMGRIMFAYIFLVCSYAYFMAILNSLGSFGLPAAAPTLFNVAMIVSTLWPTGWTEWRGQALAWGVIVGGVLQVMILIPALIQRDFLPKPTLKLKNKDVLRVLKIMGPSLVGLSLLQITTLVNLKFASSLGEGPISYLNLADRLMELPLSLVSVSIGAALLPTLSRLAAESKKQK